MTKLKVFGWQADFAGTAAYRIRFPLDALARRFDAEVRYDTKLKVSDRDWPTAVVAQRVVLPGPSTLWRQWHDEGDKVLILDVDDDLYAVSESNLRASKIFNSQGIRDQLTRNFQLADYVTVSTEPLRQSVIRNADLDPDRVIVIPNALPPELLIETVPEPGSRPYSLGYLASPTHAEDWKMVRRHVKRFLENNDTATFATIGTDYGADLKIPGRTFHRKWDSTPESAIEAIDYEMSIAPLLAGTFNRSKSDIKHLEAAARGVPSIVSDVTAYAPVTMGQTGVKVSREHEWGKALQCFWENPDERYRIAVNAHRYVAENRTTDHTAELWADIMTRGKP